MSTDLFDICALAKNRARARRMQEPALFLHELVAEQISERLNEVNRTFTNPAIVSAFPEIWQKYLPDAKIIAEDEVLALQPDCHDLIVHALSLHCSNDPLGQMIQCRRALKPDGLFLAATFGGQSLFELRASLAEAESQLAGGLRPRVAPMAELREIGGLLMRADLALPVADSDSLSVTYQDLTALMRDLRAMGEVNAMTARAKKFTSRRLFARAAEIYQQNFAAADDRINATFEVIYLTGWSPSDTQPKPLRPGSATMKLADALNTVEVPAGKIEL
ncbi:MAG: SAM-dependent methyltransferase [Alphaproteobacteria bacterium]|nr:SAM-dependent methyltransferase [Alphaproteobacteria bacterium]